MGMWIKRKNLAKMKNCLTWRGKWQGLPPLI